MSVKKHPMRWQERDGEILQAIYRFDGVLADYQIQKLFFKTSKRAAEMRLRKLLDAGFVARPDREERAQLRGFTVYWLARKGIEYITSLEGVAISELVWRRPHSRWSETKHDVLINDFRICMVQACGKHPELRLTDWIGSTEFWRDHDTIEYQFPLPGGRMERVKRGIRPDGYFVIEQEGKPPSRFLLEIDRGTASNSRIAREKFHAELAYIKSEAYRQRFGYNAGRVLFVVPTAERMKHQQERAFRGLGRGAATFYFTTNDLAQTHNVLTEAIWYRGGETIPTVLFESLRRNGR